MATLPTQSDKQDTNTKNKVALVLQFTPFNQNGEVVIEELWNVTMNDELIVFGFVRQCEKYVSWQQIIPSLIFYSCLAFYAEGNALDRKFSDYYIINDKMDDTIYNGKFSTTNKCRKLDNEHNHNENNDIVVVKILDKIQMKSTEIISIRKEVDILKQIRRLKTKCTEGSKYVITLIDLFEDEHHSYIVINYCNKGNLSQYVYNEYNEYINNYDNTKHIMKQILLGTLFLHKHNILHLSLQPLNILLHQNRNEIHVQIIKFFDSKYIDDGSEDQNKLKEIELSEFMHPAFIPPELIDGTYSIKSDSWNIGNMFFMLYCGYSPFSFDNESVQRITDFRCKLLFEKIKEGFNPIIKKGFGPWFPTHIECDDKFKDLILNLLQIDITQRFSLQESLNHPYFTGLNLMRKSCEKQPKIITKLNENYDDSVDVKTNDDIDNSYIVNVSQTLMGYQDISFINPNQSHSEYKDSNNVINNTETLMGYEETNGAYSDNESDQIIAGNITLMGDAGNILFKFDTI